MDIILYVGVFICKLNKVNKFSYKNVKVEVNVFSIKLINGDCEKKYFCVLYICIIVIKVIYLMIWFINE